MNYGTRTNISALCLTQCCFELSIGLRVIKSLSELKQVLEYILYSLEFFCWCQLLHIIDPIKRVVVNNSFLIFVWEDHYPLPSEILSEHLFKKHYAVKSKYRWVVKKFWKQAITYRKELSIATVDKNKIHNFNSIIGFVIYHPSIMPWHVFEKLINDSVDHIHFAGICSLNIPPCRIHIDVDAMLKSPRLERILLHLKNTTVYVTECDFPIIEPFARQYGFDLEVFIEEYCCLLCIVQMLGLFTLWIYFYDEIRANIRKTRNRMSRVI